MAKPQKLVIHIGHPKTGTTTLQRILLRSRKTLSANGVLFPHFGKAYPKSNQYKGNAKLLRYALLNELDGVNERSSEFRSDPERARSASEQCWSSLLEMIEKADFRKVLLSSEQFFVPRSAEDIAHLNNQAQLIAQQSEIVAYLRSPASMVVSSTQQSLKRVRPIFKPKQDYFFSTIAPLKEHFGGEVSLNIFDRPLLKDGDFLADFMSKYVPEVDVGTLKNDIGGLNETHSAEAMAILMDLKAHRLPQGHNYQALIAEVRRADDRIKSPTKPKMSSEAAQAFINFRARDLFWLRDECGLVFPDIDYGAIDADDVDREILNFDAAEQICAVNADRKAAVFQQAQKFVKLPSFVRRMFKRR